MRRLPLNGPLLLVVLFWGFNFVAIKAVQPMIGVRALALLRFPAMWFLLLLICAWRGESVRPKPGDGRAVFLVGFLSMGVYMVLFLEGMGRTSAAEGAIVLSTSPIFTYMLSVARRQETFSLPAFAAVVVAFVGVALVILGGASGEHGTPLGNLLVLVAAVAWAGSTVMMKPLLGHYSPTQVYAMSMPAGLPLLLPYGLLPVLATDFRAVTPFGWAMFGWIGLVAGVFAFILFYRGLHEIGPSGAASYQFLVPPTAALSAWAVTGKALAPLQWVGFTVVLAGVVWATKVRQAAARAALANAA